MLTRFDGGSLARGFGLRRERNLGIQADYRGF